MYFQLPSLLPASLSTIHRQCKFQVMLFSIRAQHSSTFPPALQSPITSAVRWLDQRSLSTLQTVVKLLTSCEDCCNYFGSTEQCMHPKFPPPINIISFGPKIKLPLLTNAACWSWSMLPSRVLPKLHQEDAAQCCHPSQLHPYLHLLTVFSNCFPSLTTQCCQAGPPQFHVIYLSNANDSSCTRSLRNVGYFLCLYLH